MMPVRQWLTAVQKDENCSKSNLKCETLIQTTETRGNIHFKRWHNLSWSDPAVIFMYFHKETIFIKTFLPF